MVNEIESIHHLSALKHVVSGAKIQLKSINRCANPSNFQVLQLNISSMLKVVEKFSS